MSIVFEIAPARAKDSCQLNVAAAKATRLTGSGVALELYVQPTQNVWWEISAEAESNLSHTAFWFRPFASDLRRR
jgi:hypothetical protein